MNKHVYMIERLESFALSLDASAIRTGVVLNPKSVRVRTVGVVADSADQTAAEATLDLSNTS